MEPRVFGCELCSGPDAKAVWEARGNFSPVAEIVDESHFSLRIAACRACGQRFLRVFTELIDWQGGDDSQCWCLLPLMPEECERILADKESIDAAWIEEWGSGRRHLVHIHPRGQDTGTHWAEGGFRILPHD